MVFIDLWKSSLSYLKFEFRKATFSNTLCVMRIHIFSGLFYMTAIFIILSLLMREIFH